MFDSITPFGMIGFEDEIEDLEEEYTEEEPSEEELLAEEAEFLISQQQGDWLDGYLDAMDEMEEMIDE